ncbi:hypothetical protein AMEJIAPC_02966 [Caulobacter sp. NIBR1757]|nr:hypothetical protein AMEJIAPC_02966 [Caulobacter sp. NIBR1757]
MPCIYTGKGMVRSVFEFLVFRWLEVRGVNWCQKQDIYNQLSRMDALDVGRYGAFCTRLAQAKVLKYVDWPDNEQFAKITLTDKGRRQLKAFKAGELKVEHRDYLARTIDWSGLYDPDEPDDEPTDA